MSDVMAWTRIAVQMKQDGFEIYFGSGLTELISGLGREGLSNWVDALLSKEMIYSKRKGRHPTARAPLAAPAALSLMMCEYLSVRLPRSRLDRPIPSEPLASWNEK